MVIGADTGFLIQLGGQHSRAVQIWSEARAGEHRLIFSVLCIAEYLAYHIPRGKLTIAEQTVQELEALPNVEIAPVLLETATYSARLRTGMAVPTVDSIILATFLKTPCDLVVTTDPHLTQTSVKSLVNVELLT